MSNLMGTDLCTPESTYAYMQSMPIHSFTSFHQSIVGSSSTNDFVQEEPTIVLDEQVPARNRQSPRCGIGGHGRH